MKRTDDPTPDLVEAASSFALTFSSRLAPNEHNLTERRYRDFNQTIKDRPLQPLVTRIPHVFKDSFDLLLRTNKTTQDNVHCSSVHVILNHYTNNTKDLCFEAGQILDANCNKLSRHLNRCSGLIHLFLNQPVLLCGNPQERKFVERRFNRDFQNCHL